MSFIPAALIREKRAGKEHTAQEIEFLIDAFTKGNDVKDYHMAAWAMAVYFKGMTPAETATLTQAMKNSGHVFDFSDLDAPCVDKHSTGGVGDKASLILAPIAAAAGVYIPMIAGRGLGHTGGTIDKLESIKGFNTQISKDLFAENVRRHGFALMGQTADICPADKKFYSLRDVTGTVESLPLICGSIMSKKLAEGLSGLVLDVKYGTGAFMKTQEDAISLAELLKSTGEKNGVTVTAFITNMNEPLGKYIGNSLEIKECLDILQNKSGVEDNFDYYENIRELSLILAAEMIFLGKKANSFEEGLTLAKNILASGKAYDSFCKLCSLHGATSPNELLFSKHIEPFASPASGYISKIDCEALGYAAVELRAGRKQSEDKIDFSSGMVMKAHLGKKVSRGDSLLEIHCDNKELIKAANSYLLKAFSFSDSPILREPLVAKKLT